ncbi:hypothetical protein C3L33_16873, partial [Rhododendron williamsianum]
MFGSLSETSDQIELEHEHTGQISTSFEPILRRKGTSLKSQSIDRGRTPFAQDFDLGKVNVYILAVIFRINVGVAKPFSDEVGFIHPSQFVTLNREAGGSLASSVRTTLQSEDGLLRPRVPEVNSSETVFWCRDHKLGISTQVLLPLYNAAKHAFMASLESYKSHSSVFAKKDESGGNDMSSCFSPSLNFLESELMKHSRALLLLSCDFVTAWNSRTGQFDLRQLWLVGWLKYAAPILVVLYVTRFVPKYLQAFRPSFHVLEELNKSRDWARLHIADNSCFHYRTRLMLKMLEESRDKESLTGSPGHSAELRRMWKEELDWNELLIKRHIGREALWLHRRFLSLCWMKYFATDIHDVSCRSYHKDSTSHEISVFMHDELGLVRSCSTIPDNDFEDFQAHATFSSTYILWLIKHLSESLEIELQEKLPLGELPLGELKTIMNDICPEKLFLWHSLQDVAFCALLINSNEKIRVLKKRISGDII